MSQTLEQQRAADAWQCSAGRSESYTRLVKSVPALIMNSGLMQTMAFLEDKGGGKHDSDHAVVNRQMRRWLARQFPQALTGTSQPPEEAPGYEAVMNALFQARPDQFQQITAEAMAWLRWLRQIAPTRTGESGGGHGA